MAEGFAVLGDDYCQKLDEAGPETQYCCSGNRSFTYTAPAQWSLTYVSVSYIVTAALGITLNCFTLVALSRTRVLRRLPATTFILNLAAADLMYCVFGLPADAFSYLSPDYKWDTPAASMACHFVAVTKYVGAFMDWSSLALIAMERYFKIVLGGEAHSRLFSTRNKRIMIAAVWFLHWLILLAFADYGYSEWTKRCDMIPSKKARHILQRGTSHVILMSSVVLVITCTCIKIWYHVKMSSSKIARFAMVNREEMSPSFSMTSSTAAVQLAANRPSVTYVQCSSDGFQSPSTEGTIQRYLQAPTTGIRHQPPDSYDDSDDCAASSSDSPPDAPQNGDRGSMKPGDRTGEWSKDSATMRRELGLVKILALTTGFYVVLVAPMCILNLVDFCVQNPEVRHVLYSVYVSIFWINFIIYVRTHAVYRRSCLKLLTDIAAKFGCKRNRNHVEVPIA